jgi:hypothetical protein
MAEDISDVPHNLVRENSQGFPTYPSNSSLALYPTNYLIVVAIPAPSSQKK